MGYCVRLQDFLTHFGSNGSHVCLLFEALGQNLLHLIQKYKYSGVPFNIIKKLSWYILSALDYIHRERKLIHTDLKPENIMLTRSPWYSINVENILLINSNEIKSNNSTNLNQSIHFFYNQLLIHTSVKEKTWYFQSLKNSLDSYENEKSLKQIGINNLKNTIKTSISQFRPKFKIVDFGNACWTFKHFTDDIQTRQYRSPEVVLGQHYSTSCDIWSLACLLFELATGDFLFEPKTNKRLNSINENDHLVQMEEILGAMPKKIKKIGKHAETLFSPNEDLLNPKYFNIWSIQEVLHKKYAIPIKETTAFAEFILPMLKYIPDERATAEDLLKHPWFLT